MELSNGPSHLVLSPDLESRILKDAQAHGLLREGSGGTADIGLGQAELPASVSSHWSSRMAFLLDAGRLTQESLNTLAWEAIGRDAGSWVDPLFRPPVPVEHLPGLGDRYRDLLLVGEGASAKVFKALDSLLQRYVALKILKDEAGPALVEARAQAQVEHPNICRIYEVGQGFIVMQLVEGPTLARMVPSLSQNQKLSLVRDIAHGVHAAHQKGLIHLDLKLNNILIQEGEDGSLLPIVGDFGMVMAPSGDVTGLCPMGTPPYTSPEQLAGVPSHLSPRTDVYSMGVMLYVLLAGVIPFSAQDFPGLLECMAKEQPVPLRQRLPHIPKDLAAIVHRCMEKEPGARYATAQELAEELNRFLTGEPVLAAATSWWYRMGKRARRHRRLAWAIGLGIAGIMASSGFGYTHTQYVYKQAEWDHQFQKLVADAHLRLDNAYRLPLHDIEPEREQVRRILGTIQGEMAIQGRAAAGPGHLAQGQILLLLSQNDSTAAGHFQKAWDLGFRTEGARIWLAFSLLQAFNHAEKMASQAQNSRASEALVSEARLRYLEPARRMLQGHRNPDQAYLAHQLEKAELWASKTKEPDAALALARKYRAHFPDDLEGRLEEADALISKASSLWDKSFLATRAWPPPCEKEVGPLRNECQKLLLEALRIAPSHPGVYDRLAWSCLNGNNRPTETIQDRQSNLKQARSWLEQGLKASPKDSVLSALLLGYLENELQRRLGLGLNPEPLAREWLGLFQRDWASRDDGQVVRGLYSIRSYIQTCAWFGLPILGFAEEARGGMARDPWHEAGLPPESYSIQWLLLTIGESILEAGGDPTPFLQSNLGTGDPGPTPKLGWPSFEARLLQAEYRRLTGGQVAPLLQEMEQRYLRHREAAQGTRFELRMRLLQARFLDTPESWGELESCLGRVGAGPKQHGLAPGTDLLTEVRLCLVRHFMGEGRGVDSWLRTARQGLEAEMADTRAPYPLLRERLAELYLLEAKRGGAVAATLRHGLEQIAPLSKALEAPRRYEAISRLHRALTYGSNSYSAAGSYPRWGRIFMIRGELLLALAQVEPPAEKRRLSLQAQHAFQRALKYNRNLQHDLASLQDRARRLVAQGR